jgi:hypothetical protein
MPTICSRLLTVAVLVCLTAPALAEEPCVSGVPPGQRPGPYAFILSTGPKRGQSHCYICETGDKPAVVIFARSLTGPLGKLTAQVDRVIGEQKEADLRGWVTFLADNQTDLDPKVVRWSQDHALRNLPAGVFEDPVGPPSYRLANDADVTVLLFVKQKVVANFAFRTGELTDAKAAEVVKAIPRLISNQ